MQDWCMHVRDATPEDAVKVSEVHVRTWQIAYRGLLPGEFLESMRPEERAKRYNFGDLDPGVPQTLLALEGDQVLGFATVGAGRDADLPACGELYALYVDPPWWDRRVGLALMQAARARLADCGFTRALLWLLQGNERAARFYLRDGWQFDGATRTETAFGVALEERRMLTSL